MNRSLNRPYIYRSRPARKPSALWLAVLVGVGLNLVGLVLILVLVGQQGTPERPGSGRGAGAAQTATDAPEASTAAPSGLPDSEEFDALVYGKSADELRAKIGEPESIEPCMAPQRSFGSMGGALDHLQAVAAGASDPGYQRWTYRNVTSDWGVVFITVGFDQVVDVQYADGK